MHPPPGEAPETVFEPGGVTVGEQSVTLHLGGREISLHDPMLVKVIVHGAMNAAALEPALTAFDHAVLLVRDPRDWIISRYLYSWYREHQPVAKFYRRAVRLVRRKEAAPVSLPFFRLLAAGNASGRDLGEEIVPAYAELRQLLTMAGAGAFVMRYEDFVAGRIEVLSAHLGLDLSADVRVDDSVARVARSRSSANWRKWFTPADVEFFSPRIDPILRACGYDADDWRLDETPVLDPRTGSGYMQRLYEGDWSGRPAGWRSVWRRLATGRG